MRELGGRGRGENSLAERIAKGIGLSVRTGGKLLTAMGSAGQRPLTPSGRGGEGDGARAGGALCGGLGMISSTYVDIE